MIEPSSCIDLYIYMRHVVHMCTPTQPGNHAFLYIWELAFRDLLWTNQIHVNIWGLGEVLRTPRKIPPIHVYIGKECVYPQCRPSHIYRKDFA